MCLFCSVIHVRNLKGFFSLLSFALHHQQNAAGAPTLSSTKNVMEETTQTLDIANIVRLTSSEITYEIRLALIKNCQPEPDFKYPPKQYADKSRKEGVRQRYCSRDWFRMYYMLCYLKSTDGFFCLCCVLFPMPAHQGKRAANMITSPYSNWKDAKSELDKHVNLQYYRDLKSKMESFLQMMRNPSLVIENRVRLQEEQRIVKNRTFLTSILKFLEVCGRRGIGLRGHRDDTTSDALNQGNFKALLNVRVDAGNTELHDHLQTCARIASYISKTSQNQLLQCIKKYIQDVLVQQVKDGGGWYGIEADEVTNASNWEQLGLVFRYHYNFTTDKGGLLTTPAGGGEIIYSKCSCHATEGSATFY